MIQALMIKIYNYLGRRLNVANHSAIINPEIQSILPDIELLVQKQEKMPGVDGEFKRHRAYTIAMKRYPEMRKRDLSLAIEIAVQNK